MTLCNTCANAIATHCKFMGGPDAEVGLKAMGATEVEERTEKKFGGSTFKIYRVKKCASYKRGQPPPVQWGFGE